MGLNGLLGFKGPTHLLPTQTHPFDTPSYERVLGQCLVIREHYRLLV